MVSCSGELVIGSDFSRLTLSDNETAGLAWLSGEINAVARATRVGRPAFQFCTFISYSHTAPRAW
jgi:hypothetical protein